jgi:Family of unknown function (DUF5996)
MREDDMDEERTGSAGSLAGRAKPEGWPELTLGGWPDTRVTLNLWTQVLGKIRLALEPAVNHWWQVPLYLSARGLTTSIMHAKDRGLEIEFDFIDHVLALQTTSGKRRTVALEPRRRSPLLGRAPPVSPRPEHLSRQVHR